jgi:DNA-binding PadR family transcriptional regulator
VTGRLPGVTTSDSECNILRIGGIRKRGSVPLADTTKRLTTVSYAVLGLLGLRPHTPYELAQQFKRSGVFWSAAESVVYEEPKTLVAGGLAKAAREREGGRARTRYSITAKGRRELSRWLSKPSGGPQVQFEAMLKVLFADAGTKDDVLASIKTVRAWTEATRADGRAISQSYLDGTAPYPDRAHIVRLTMAYQIGFVELVERWADWAEGQVRLWDETVAPGPVDLGVFAQVVAGLSLFTASGHEPEDAMGRR